MNNALDVLRERGFVYQVSDEAGLLAAVERPITAYAGFDATAESLHVGNLVPIMALANLQHLGHRPIVVVGGGTTMIGDPTDRTTERPMLSREEIAARVARFKQQLSRFLDFSEERALLVDNADWLLELKLVDFLRDYGRHFVVNQMIHTDTYATRLETGLTFFEFAYAPLQAYDFLHLYLAHGCRVQIGGTDQWANSLAGAGLIRKVKGAEAFVFTCPLITLPSGAKMSKSAPGGAVWLDATLNSPYEYYQYWINADDRFVAQYLALFTFLPMAEVRDLGGLVGAERRRANEVLAFEATKLAHGDTAARLAQTAARALFGRATDEELAQAELVPTTQLSASELEYGMTAVDLLTRTGLAPSRAGARRLIEQGGAYLNDERLRAPDQRITTSDLATGPLILRAGKKRYHRVVVKN